MDDFFKRMITKRTEEVKSKGHNSLDLVKLRLESIPEEAFSCTEIRELHLESDCSFEDGGIYLSEEYWWEVSHDNNTIYKIPSDIAELKKLELLDITQNNVSLIDPGIGKLKKLKKLLLSNNNLETLPDEIGELESLEELDLSYNSLTELPGEIGNLKNLKILNLNSNNLKALPPEIGQLQNLEILDIGNFDIKKIDPDVIDRFGLCTNHFSSLPPEIANLKNLKEIRAENNTLSEDLEETFEWGLEAFLYILKNPD